MSVIRENNFVESMKALRENQNRRIEEATKAYLEKVAARESFLENYHSILENREQQRKEYTALVEAIKDNTLSKALKAIYITALEEATLTDNALILAESMVDTWIKENGGATKILSECRDKTYLLNRIATIVEDAAKEELENIEKVGKEDAEEKEEKPAAAEETKKEEKKEEAPAEDKSADPLNTQFEDDEIPDDATTKEDDNETDIADDITDDLEQTPEEDLTVDGNSENDSKLFDELEKEEDVKKAIELIRQRVADAEETFIKRNAEDKKAVDELISRISDNVKTVEDMEKEAESDPDAREKAEVAEESARLNRRRINEITENRPLNLFEKMARNISESITKDGILREQYVTENGNLDTALTVESVKVMYGFLETVNTLQLEKVDENYIKKLISEM